MDKKAFKFILLFVALAGFALAGYLLWPKHLSTDDVILPGSYQDASYEINGQVTTLANGVAEQPGATGAAEKITTKFFGNEAAADLNALAYFKTHKLPIIITNWPLILGVCIYAASAVILVFALKGDDVSTLYPITASSYIWVTFFAVYFFHESLSLFKIAGLLFVFTGVVLLGTSAKKKSVIPIVAMVR